MYALARELGYANVDVMLAGMTSKQVTEWMAFFQIESDRIEGRRNPAKKEDTAVMECRLKQSLQSFQARRDARKKHHG